MSSVKTSGLRSYKMPQRKPTIQVVDKTKHHIPFTYTVLIFVLLALSVYLLLSDYTVPIAIKTELFEITTKSAGIVVLVLVVWLAIDINRHPTKKGYEQAVYDIVPPSVQEVKCPECGSSISILQPICPICGHKRPLF